MLLRPYMGWYTREEGCPFYFLSLGRKYSRYSSSRIIRPPPPPFVLGRERQSVIGIGGKKGRGFIDGDVKAGGEREEFREKKK